MPIFPSPLTDFSAVSGAMSNAPILSGTSAVQAQVPPNRGAVSTRNMIRWFVPEIGVIEMYINPQNITYQEKKHITEQRTKGGYLVQYWGEELQQISIDGTTGTSGIEGINVLRDIYRNEQLVYEPYALARATEREKELDTLSIFDDFSNNFLNMVDNATKTGSPVISKERPSLASLALSVEMYYGGWIYRGYFKDFRVTERADRLGLFDYTMTFMATQRRGIRLNFLGWHRSATHGPSNSDPEFGRPYSYAGLFSEQASPTNLKTNNDVISLSDVLNGANSIVSSVGDAFTSIF